MIDLSNPTIKTFHETANLINKGLKPVIFWDTCSLIDIIRLPLPSRNNKVILNDRIVEIKNAIVNDKVYSLSSEICIKELTDHVPTYINSYSKELSELSDKTNNFISFLNKSGLVSAPIGNINLGNYKLEQYFSDLTQAIIDKTIFIRKHEDFSKNAANRAIDRITPARHKKGETKDCYIWETCLQTRTLLSDETKLWSFISSNIDDYTDRKTTASFAPDIQTEVTTHNISYAKDFHILYKQFSDASII